MIDWNQLITPQDKRDELLDAAITELRAERQPIIGVLDGLQASALASGDAAAASDIETAKQELRDLTKIDLADCATHEDMRAKVKQAYYVIVSAAPANVIRAFSEVLK